LATRLRPLVVAVGLVATLGVLPSAVGTARAQAQAAAAQPYDLPAGALDVTLTRIARQAGRVATLEPRLVGGRQAAPVRGTFTVEQAFAQALAGTRLEMFVTAGGALSVRPAPAQTGDATLAPVMVTAFGLGNDITSEGTGSYAVRGASIMKGAQSLKEIPQSVSVITSQRMEDQNLTSVQQAMEQATGIYVNSYRSVYSGNGSSANYYSRGFEIDNYMVDGVVSDSADTYSTNMGLEGSSAIYDRVEILRGAAGLLVGQGNPGGTVNLVRKRPTREFQQNYSLSAGSWSNYRGEADLSGSLNASGSVRGRVVTAYQDRDRFWNSTNSNASLLYGIVEADITPSTQIALGLRYEKSKETAPKQNYFANTSFTPERRRNYSPTWGYHDTEDKELFLNIDHQISNRWKLVLAASHWERDYEGVMTIVNTTRGNVQAIKTEQKTDRFDINLLGSFDALGREHTVTFGVNASKWDRDGRSLWSPAVTSANLENNWYWIYDEATKNMVSSTFAGNPDRTESKSYGFFGKLNFKLTDDLTAILGGRTSWYQYDYWNESGVYRPNDGGRVNHEFTPYAGLVYALTPQWSTYASYADIFAPQWGYYTRSGSLIDHKTGKNYELGIKGELLEGRLNAAFAIYQVDLENAAMREAAPYDSACPGNPTGGACYIAVGESRTRGFDAEVNGELLSGWQMGAGYTYTHQENLKADFNEGYAMTYTPRHMFKLFSSYQINDQWTLGGGVQVQSKEVAMDSDGPGQSGYSVWNAFARYRINQNLDVSLNAKNLFDKTYWANGAAYYQSLYGEPRSYMLTLRAKF
ncbi:TonB-dependent siderophore receptor, partial [Thauera linaloolentis]